MTFYFFDLETSGFSGRHDRIMQFAGQRTDKNLDPLGEPDNILVKLTPDVLPQPDAVLVHGITPQKTLSGGVPEADFCRYLTSQVSSPDTVLVGYNNVRFDNEFIRFTLWRNFYDAYEWSWKDNCSVWDLLDVVRMTRALRPEGIKWPFAPDGAPSNKLEYLTSVNGLDHADAHDALSDVRACLALARLLREKQLKLFDYLFEHRHKSRVAPLVSSGKPFIYTSGRYPAEYNRTSVAAMVAELEDKSGAIVYDLRIDPDEFSRLSAAELSRRWADRSEVAPYFPVKILKYNKCPAVAAIEVLKKDDGYSKLQLHEQMVDNHFYKLKAAGIFGAKLLDVLETVWPQRQARLVPDALSVDSQLYDGFIPDGDKTKMSAVRAAAGQDLAKLELDFKDDRLNRLLPIYKARNYPAALDESERAAWEKFRTSKLLDSGRADIYLKRLQELAETPGIGAEKLQLIEELNRYAQSILPIPVS